MNPTSPEQTLEQVAPHIRLEYIEQGQIVIWTVRTVDRVQLDLYLQRALEIVRNWPSNRPYVHVEDFADPAIGATPVVRDLTARISSALAERNLLNVTALVVSKTLTAQIARVAMSRLSRNERRVANMFFTRDEAISWARKQIGTQEDSFSA